MMPEDGLDTLAAYDEIYLGAVGWPTVPDHLSLWGLLLPIRRTFDQYVNLRPARLLRGVNSPLAEPNDLDITVVRENTEGEYSDSGGRVYKGTPYEIAVQESIFTRRGVERIIRYAFEEARARRGLLVGATKSNGISVTMPFFDEIFREISSEYHEVEASLMHADALAARLVLAPHSFDVVVGSLPLRTHPRLGPRYSGRGHSKPIRRDLGRGHDAGARRVSGSRRPCPRRTRRDPGFRHQDQRPRGHSHHRRDGRSCRAEA
jgi:tartrate dehydrogenase/decarboxylase/D-malate dehydrogenase